MKLLNDVIVHILFHESKDKLSKSSKEKEKKIYKLRKEIKKIHQDYEDEILDIKTYSDIIQRLNNRIKILNEQIIGLKIKGKNEFFSSTIVQKHTYIQSKVRMIEVNMELQTAINIEWKGDLIK